MIQDLASTRPQSNDTFYSLQNLCSITALVQGGQIDEVLTAASLINKKMLLYPHFSVSVASIFASLSSCLFVICN